MRKTMLWAAALCALMLSACGAKAPEEAAKAASAAEETVQEAKEESLSQETEKETQAQETAASLPVIEDANLEVFLGLMGKSADEAAAALGEGRAMTNEEDILINRDYSAELFGHKADVMLSFNLYQYEKDLLELCNISFEDGSLEELKEQLTPILGEGEVLSEYSYSWDTDTSNVILAAPFEGTLYIEIALNQ